MLILLLILLPAGTGFAAPAGLYTGEVLVESQQQSERNRALPLALKQVLQKLSGQGSFDDYPLVEPVLDRAASILVSFYYRNVESILADNSVASQLRLVARFSEAEVNQLLRKLQLPLWLAERQPTEIWVVVDDGAGRRIMPVEYAYAWESMNKIAAARGLPVSWPEPDEEGIFPVDAQLLWGGYTEDIAGVDGAVMIAAARREGAQWSVRINLVYGQQNWAWRQHDVDLQQALSDSMHQAVNLLAAANTIAATDQGKWLHELTVTGIGGAQDYRRCLGYLQNLSVVERVSVTSASREMIRFSLELKAMPLYLDEALARRKCDDS
ncbi:MAG: DUF2066 domain-containing protein [Xanthomonadales bacterium]